jgi:hypothetical protein
MMMRILLVACAVAIGMHSLPEASAASCGFESLRRSLTRDVADVVFDGIVLDVQSVRAGEVVILDVVQVWKGNVSKRFTIHNARPVSNIDFTAAVSGFMRFEKGQRYVVFAHRMTADERALFGLADIRESFGTAVCRDGSQPVGPAELSELPAGRTPVGTTDR